MGPASSQGMSSGRTLERQEGFLQEEGLGWILKNAGEGNNLRFTEHSLWATRRQANQCSLS